MRHFRRIEFRHRAERGDITALVVSLGSLVEHHARRRDLDRHVGEPKADGLVLDDRLAERAAFDRAPGRLAIGGERETERLRSDQHPPDIERGEGKPQGATGLAHARAVGHHDVELEIGRLRAAQSHLVDELVDDDAGLLPGDHEGRDAASARALIRLRKHHVMARRPAVADPVLLAAQAPAVALAGGARLDRRGIRAGGALG